MLAVRAALSLAPQIVLYFALSISITFSMKWVYSSDGLCFHFPLLFVEVLLVLQCFLARALVRCGVGAPAAPAAPAAGADAADARRVFWRAVVPVGACTAAEIALSNASLLTLSVSFHTMVKSSTPVFVMLGSFAMGLERARGRLVAIVLLIAGGVATLSAGGDLSSQPAAAAPDGAAAAAARAPFSPVGFALVVASAGAAGARWALSQALLQRHALAPLALLADMLPVAALCLLPFAAALDAPRAWRMARALDAAERAPLAVALGAFVLALPLAALALVHTELELIARTSSLTVSILGTVKELALVGLSIALLHDAISGLNWAVRAPPPPPPPPPPCPPRSPARRPRSSPFPDAAIFPKRRAPTLREEAS